MSDLTEFVRLWLLATAGDTKQIGPLCSVGKRLGMDPKMIGREVATTHLANTIKIKSYDPARPIEIQKL